VFRKIDTFLFEYKSKPPFVFLRIATAFLCLISFACLAGDMQNLVGLDGYVGREIMEATIYSAILPRISWLIDPLMHVGISDAGSITIIMGVYLAAILFMLAGLFTRPAIAIVWMIHLMLYQSTILFSYGVDAFTNLLLFYCLIMPTNKYYALDTVLLKNKKTSNPVYESFFMRVLQIHLCIAYFFGGIGKLIMPGWISADGIWKSLMLVNFKIIDFSFLANYPIVTTTLGCVIVALELLYPIFIYIDKTRRLWLIGIILMHVFIGLFMSLPFFGLVMIIFNIAAFGWNDFFSSRSSL
jgi:hypothetical protein